MAVIARSDKGFSRDNQQERLDPWWIVGFVDGEGCFSSSTFKSGPRRSSYQNFFEFVITQGELSLSALERVKDYFQCGGIYINRRYDNHKYNLYRYCIRKKDDLANKIIPFFRKYPLQTSKRAQFEKFCKHFENRESSETIRQALKKRDEDMAQTSKSKFEETSEVPRQGSRRGGGRIWLYAGTTQESCTTYYRHSGRVQNR